MVHDNVIMLHDSVIMFICPCHAHIVLAVSVSCYLLILSGYYDYFHDGIWYYFGSITLDVMLLMSCCYEDLMLIHA